jgi:hypothetical protein
MPMNARETMRRADKIKKKLASQELFLLWLGDLPVFDSAADCAAWMFGQAAESPDKVSQLVGEVASAVRIPLVGHTWPYVEAAVSLAQREVLFLYFLYVGLNVHVLAQRSAYRRSCQSLTSALSRALERGELLLKLREVLCPVNGTRVPLGGTATEDIRRCVVLSEGELEDLRKEGELLKRSMVEAQLVVDLITRLYFAERPVLWKSASEFLGASRSDEFKILEEQLRAADELVNAGGLESLDLSNVSDTRPATEAQAKRTAQGLVVMARVDAARRMGKREEARELLIRRIKQEENCEAEAEALLGLESPGGPRAQTEI